MKKLLALIASAIAALAGYKKLIADQKAEIQRLHDLLDNEAIDDAERDAKLADFEASEQEANEAAEKLAVQLNDEPVVQSVNPETFEVTSGPTSDISDLELREAQAQEQGKVPETPAVQSDPNAQPAAEDQPSEEENSDEPEAKKSKRSKKGGE